MLDFPNAPFIGQGWIDPNGTVWKWDGVKWVKQNAPTIPEAPLDNFTYGRQSASWTQVLMVSGDILDGGNF
jgi:hypothetical protein